MKRKHKESSLQITCVKWFRYQYPNVLIFAIPNGGQRSAITAAILKAEGVLAGVSDLMVLKPKYEKDIVNEYCVKYHGLFIEMKTDEGKQTDSQMDFEQYCKDNGYKYVVCRSLEEFIKEVNEYLGE